MKVRGKELTKKMVVMLALGLLLAGTASAALVNYVSNSLTASVDVSAVSLELGLAEADPADPTTFSGWDDGSGGVIPLTGITAGDDSEIVTLMISNPTSQDLTADVNIALNYINTEGIDDPENCDANGMYDPAGSEPCAVCGLSNDELCMDGQEFEVIGVRVWNDEYDRWGPRVNSNPFGDNCEDAGITVAGDYNDEVYYDGNHCYWNFADEVQAQVSAGENPLTLIGTSNQNIPPGALYTQILVKSKFDGTSGLQIAPGEYSLTANIQ